MNFRSFGYLCECPQAFENVRPFGRSLKTRFYTGNGVSTSISRSCVPLDQRPAIRALNLSALSSFSFHSRIKFQLLPPPLSVYIIISRQAPHGMPAFPSGLTAYVRPDGSGSGMLRLFVFARKSPSTIRSTIRVDLWFLSITNRQNC